MLKSPLSGLCVIELLSQKEEKTLGFGETEIVGAATTPEHSYFQVVRTYDCPSMLLQQRSDFELFGRYAYLGGLSNSLHQVDLLAREPNLTLKLHAAGLAPSKRPQSKGKRGKNCEIFCVLDTCSTGGRDELTIFTASKIRKQGFRQNTPEGWNNNVQVCKRDLGACRHKVDVTDERVQKAAADTPMQV